MSVPIRYDPSTHGKRKLDNDSDTSTNTDSGIAKFIVNMSKQLMVSLNNTVSSTSPNATGLSIGNFGIIRSPYIVGGLWGNYFKIVIRNIRASTNADDTNTDTDANAHDVDSISGYLNANLEVLKSIGFPNYFG